MINGGAETGDVSLAPVTELFPLGGHCAGQACGKGGRPGLEAEQLRAQGRGRPHSPCQAKWTRGHRLPMERERQKKAKCTWAHAPGAERLTPSANRVASVLPSPPHPGHTWAAGKRDCSQAFCRPSKGSRSSRTPTRVAEGAEEPGLGAPPEDAGERGPRRMQCVQAHGCSDTRAMNWHMRVLWADSQCNKPPIHSRVKTPHAGCGDTKRI